MKLHHLSASSAKMFEACEAQWGAKYDGGGMDIGGEAAGLGSAIHTALEKLVALDEHLGADAWDKLLAHYDDAYWQELPTAEKYDEGKKIIGDWLARTDWSGRTVLSTEDRLEFMLETKYGEVPMVYIIDRLDRHDDGDLEVVDYKSGVWTLSYEQLRSDVQARTYATAIWKSHGAQRVWVTFDYLRSNPVGVRFTAEQCQDHYNYLVRLAERIIESDGTKETVGSGCRFCLRRSECVSLRRYAQNNVALTGTLGQLIARRAEIDAAQKALTESLKELDGVLMRHFDESGETELVGDQGQKARLASRRYRQVDSDGVAQILEPAMLARYATVSVSAVDELLANEDLDPDTVVKLRALVRTRNSAPSIRVE